MDYEFINSFKKYQKTGNFWQDLNPITKLIIAFAIGLSTIAVGDWRYGFVWCGIYFVVGAMAGCGKKFAKVYLVLFLIIGVFLTIIRQIGHRDGNVTVMFSIFGWKWYLESFVTAMNVNSYMLGFAGAVLLFFNITPMQDLMYSLEQLGVPHETSFIMLSSMQSIVDLRKTSVTIMESQKSRGIETDGNVISRAKAFFPTIGPLMLGAFSSTEEKSIAMDARAFSVDREHTFIRELEPMTGGQKAACVIAVVGLVGLLVLRIVLAFTR